MYKKKFRIRFSALLLTVIMLFGMVIPGFSALDFDGSDTYELLEESYTDDETVRVSIVLEDAPTITVPYSIDGIAANKDAMEYRHRLEQIQDLVVDNIETYALGGQELDVVWNLTLLANIISANVEYGQIDKIKDMNGVVDVFVEERVYLDIMDTAETVAPAMVGSSAMSGSSLAHSAGYTGAGSRVAIIDTGIDTDHRSFNADAFEYSLGLLEEKGLIHIDDLDLMTEATIEGVLPELNIANKAIDVNSLYYSSKLPFAYNYAEPGTDVNHHEGQTPKDMEHGSHVAGIAAANTYVPDNENDGEYLYAADAVGVCGIAPDAQILTMRVFDKSGGAYESTYMVAIEDAIMLGADSINLSLGSSTPGFNRSDVYTKILENLVNSGSVCVASAGNNGAWADYGTMGDGTTRSGNLLLEDVNFNTVGSPGSFSSTFSVGSVDNSNITQSYFTVDGQWVFYHAVQTNADSLSSVAGENQYIYLPAGTGTSDELNDIVTGKIAVCERDGKTPLVKIAENAAKAGAISVIIVNNKEGTLDPVFSDYNESVPVVTVSKADGVFLKQAAETVSGSSDTVYYQGNLTVRNNVSDQKNEYYTMSFFSSFGVPGNLSLAPDIVAPGGNILSVNGRPLGGQAYVSFSGTSMAGPQVAGMSSVLAQYVRNLKFASAERSARFLIQNLLMSTAVPFKDAESQNYYSVFRQGSGMADLDRALNAQALILMGSEATPQYNDGKVKAEFGDDVDKTGKYSYNFTVENFSGKENSYKLSTELFTQDIKKQQPISDWETKDILDKKTISLDADITYEINGNTLTEGSSFTVKANEKVNVSVTIRLTDEQKEKLTDSYPNGAYVEGYTFITGLADNEGVRDVEYSIPLIGFYGDWSKPSMYDHSNYIDRLYGDDTPSYVSKYFKGYNYLNIVDPETDETRIYMGNPYVVEDEFPADRGAVRSTDIISGYTTILIRSAAAASVFLTNEKNEFISMGQVRKQVNAASNYKGTWMSSVTNIPFNLSPASMNLKDGDVFNVNAVAVPEYYESGGGITKEELTELIKQDKLAEGAYLSTKLTVDDESPKILNVKNTDGILTVTAQDNHHIAYISVTDLSGTVVFDGCVPEGKEGEPVTCTFDLNKINVGPTCMIFVGDYAANSVTEKHSTGKSYPSYNGKLGGYVQTGNNGYGKAWIVIDPSDLQAGKSFTVDKVAFNGRDHVTSAAYVDGYVYQVIGSKLYTSPADEIDNLTELVDLERFRLHSVYALSYNKTNHMLYALTEENVLWSIDPKNGKAEKIAEITVSDSFGKASHIVSMAIDRDGNFYGITYYESVSSSLVKWNINDASKNNTVIAQKVKTSGAVIQDRFGSMAYDSDKNVLYVAESTVEDYYSLNNHLLCIDLTTYSVVQSKQSLSHFVNGLFAVPSDGGKDGTLAPTEKIQNLEFLTQSLDMFVTGQENISPLITPWTATDKELVWEISDPGVVKVENGILTALKPGTATVTVKVKAAPEITASCSVNVKDIPSIQMSAVVYNKDRTGYLADYDVASPEKLTVTTELTSAYSFVAGGLSNDKLYLHDNYFMYTVDKQTGNAQQLMMFTYLEFAWSDAAQNPDTVATGYEVAGVYKQQNGSNIGEYSLKLRAPLSNKLNFNSPAATLAYIDDVGNKAGSRYYVLLENGGLYKITFPLKESDTEFLGIVPGINLKGVSENKRGVSASMWYDAQNELLVLSSHIKGDRARIQLIDPKKARVMSTREFGEDIWYVTALYQNDSKTDSSQNLLSSANNKVVSKSYAKQADQNQTHSVYEGLEKLLAVPIIRPYAMKSNVAAVGNATYSTLQDAVDAAHNQIISGNHGPQTVTLLSDVTESVRNIWIRNHVDYNYELTIDLNGHKITGKNDNAPVLWFEAGGLGGAKYGYHITVTDSSPNQSGVITGGTGRPDIFSKTNGGGIYFSGSTVNDSLTFSGGTICDNNVTGNGGAIAMSGDCAAQLKIEGGVITDNNSANGAVSGRWITVNGGTIENNHATNAGGGLYMFGAGTQDLEIGNNARIFGNTADVMGDDITVVSQRGGVIYKVGLSDPSKWTGEENYDNAAWCVDGAEGLYDYSNKKDKIKRYDVFEPQKLESYTVTETGRNAQAYGIAAKMVKDITEIPLLGDVNFDGIVNLNDYAMVRNYVMCRRSLTKEEFIIADYNKDGVVDAFDVIAIDVYINSRP